MIRSCHLHTLFQLQSDQQKDDQTAKEVLRAGTTAGSAGKVPGFDQVFNDVLRGNEVVDHQSLASMLQHRTKHSIFGVHHQ